MGTFRGFRVDRLREAMKENGATFEDIVKSLCKAFELTDMDFARECAKNLMCSDNYDISTGGFSVVCNDLYSICRVVNVSADYLLGLSDEMY